MHLGVIPDGNRRYAERKGIENREAYLQAKNVIKDIVKSIDSFPVEIDELTFYLLSEENLQRDGNQLEVLFELLRDHLEEVMEELNGSEDFDKVAEEKLGDRPEKLKDYREEDFRFNWARTSSSSIPGDIAQSMTELEERFDSGEKVFNAVISYSGKKDILNAARKSSNDGGFDRESFENKLQIDSDIDYVIRTGDNPRRECLSGFPIWNSSYAEFYHIEKHFPEVQVEDFMEALNHFEELRRRRGK